MFEIFAQTLSLFYSLTHSYGMAIILLTVIVRLAMFPLTHKQMKSMQGMAKVQPEVKRLQAEYRDDRMKLQEEMMALYKREGISPAGGCLPLLLQIPVFIGLYNVIRGLSHSGRLKGLQISVPMPQYLSTDSEMYRSIVDRGGVLKSFGINLAESASGVTKVSQRWPYMLLIILYVGTAYYQQHRANSRNPGATGQAAQVAQMMKFFPIFLGFIYYSMPAGLVLYFVASNIWTIGQQEVLYRAMPNPTVVDVASTEVAAKKGVDPDQASLPASKARNSKPKPGQTPPRPFTPPSANTNKGSGGSAKALGGTVKAGKSDKGVEQATGAAASPKGGGASGGSVTPTESTSDGSGAATPRRSRQNKGKGR